MSHRLGAAFTKDGTGKLNIQKQDKELHLLSQNSSDPLVWMRVKSICQVVTVQVKDGQTLMIHDLQSRKNVNVFLV